MKLREAYGRTNKYNRPKTNRPAYEKPAGRIQRALARFPERPLALLRYGQIWTVRQR